MQKLTGIMGDLLQRFELQYGPVRLGQITDAFCGDPGAETWFGNFSANPEAGSSDLESRVREFIALSQEWHERMDCGEEIDASDFESFEDIVKSSAWVIQGPDESIMKIRCPVFSSGEVSWTPICADESD